MLRGTDKSAAGTATLKITLDWPAHRFPLSTAVLAELGSLLTQVTSWHQPAATCAVILPDCQKVRNEMSHAKHGCLIA